MTMMTTTISESQELWPPQSHSYSETVYHGRSYQWQCLGKPTFSFPADNSSLSSKGYKERRNPTHSYYKK
ncbi:hypothetical protein NC652_016579 [Populus alba x Populus x berolinensis]|nr:hypothetical protein NC651_016063 [Populus alba x Populus x berolinensis]KAJ6922968.1 hypothetical protein NC652_016579 [Populus alba x Populus x berolinensis]